MIYRVRWCERLNPRNIASTEVAATCADGMMAALRKVIGRKPIKVLQVMACNLRDWKWKA